MKEKFLMLSLSPLSLILLLLLFFEKEGRKKEYNI
jgi:hypothetical protein